MMLEDPYGIGADRDGDTKMTIQIQIAFELFEIHGEEGPEVAERFFVSFATSKGRRFHHEVSFASVELAHDAEYGSFYRRVWDAEARAEAFAARIQAHLDAGGKLDATRWEEVAPVYGSEAYEAFEAQVIAPAVALAARGGNAADLPSLVRAYL